MIRYLLDADIVIYALTGQRPAMRSRFEERELGEVGLSAITLAEVCVGIAISDRSEAKAFASFLTRYPVLDFDAQAARVYGKLPFKRARFGRLLAAHALAIGATVVTNSEADFADIPGLKLENWTL